MKPDLDIKPLTKDLKKILKMSSSQLALTPMRHSKPAVMTRRMKKKQETDSEIDKTWKMNKQEANMEILYAEACEETE